jgi:hypothetical protein
MGNAVEQLVGDSRAAAADRVVAAESILGDGHQRLGPVGIEDIALAQEDRARLLHGVGRMVTLVGVASIVAEKIDGLLALGVDDAQGLAAIDDAAPVAAGRDDLVVQNLVGFPRSLEFNHLP